MAYLLLVRPFYDGVTQALHTWANIVVQTVLSSGAHTCTDLSKGMATRANTETYLQQGTNCLAFYGHGGADRLFAQDGRQGTPAAVDTRNHSLLKDKVICAVACDSARTLGPEAVTQQRARAYIGYNDLLGIVWGGPELWFQHAANAAILFLLTWTPGPRATCSAAVSFATLAYDSGIQYYSRGAGVGHLNYALAAAWLRWNRDSLKLLGDPDATL